MAEILVVDDEPAIRDIATRILQSAGLEVVTASNGLEAIRLYRFAPKRFSLIITDLIMPRMNGRQLVSLVRQTNPAAKIICMSGTCEEGCPEHTAFLHFFRTL